MRRGEDVDEDAGLAGVEVRPWWRARARGRGGTVERPPASEVLNSPMRPCRKTDGVRADKVALRC
jgi:hypothetical protein